MLNQVVAVGKIAKDMEIIKENEKNKTIMTIAIPRSYKNADGIYETDFISCVLYDSIATNVVEHCKKGDVVGIKGRLQNGIIANDDGEIIAKTIEVIAEKVSFLKSSKANE